MLSAPDAIKHLSGIKPFLLILKQVSKFSSGIRAFFTLLLSPVEPCFKKRR